MVVGIDATVSFLPHVVLQCRFVPEDFFTVQTLQAYGGEKIHLL